MGQGKLTLLVSCISINSNMDFRIITLDSLRKKYPFQLGKSLFQADSWLSLEVMAVLAIITTLSLLGLKLTADYLYKVAFAAPLSNQFVESRIEQQEYYAWHGTFDASRRDYELGLSSKQLPQIDQLYSHNGRMIIAMQPFHQYPSTQVTLMLDDSHNSVIKPVCTVKQDETFHLMPFVCKEGSLKKSSVKKSSVKKTPANKQLKINQTQ